MMTDQPQVWHEVARRAARPLLNAVIFLAVLLTTGEVVRWRLPFPPVPSVQPKVAWLLEHGDDYDTPFVGSSRTCRQLIPELFEARYRKDEAHLNPAGAEIFTRLLVERLLQL